MTREEITEQLSATGAVFIEGYDILDYYVRFDYKSGEEQKVLVIEVRAK